MQGTSITFSKRFTMVDRIGAKDHLLLTTKDSGSQSTLKDQKLFFTDNRYTNFRITTFDFGTNHRNVYSGFTSGTYVTRYGASCFAQIKNSLYVGGSVKPSASTASDFVPAIVKFNKGTMAVEDATVVTPTHINSGTSFTVDMLVQNTVTKTFMGASFPRSAWNSELTLSLTEPLMLFIIRTADSSPAIQTGCPEVDVMMVKFSNLDAIDDPRLFYISNDGTASIRYWITASRWSFEKGMLAYADSYISHYQLPGDFQCQADGSVRATTELVAGVPIYATVTSTATTQLVASSAGSNGNVCW